MTNTDLRSQIRECVDAAAPPVTAAEIRQRAATGSRRLPARGVPLGRVPVRGVPVRLAVTVTGVAAAAIAGGLVASEAGGAAPVATRTVLTAAMVKHVASASRTAMTSGEAGIHWTSDGLPSVTQDISFDGANWNDVLNPGQPSQIVHHGKLIERTGESINRVVDGQQYHYPGAVFTSHGIEFKGWTRFPAPAGGQTLSIPDPRTLLSVLSPSAGFVSEGTSTVAGVTVTHLTATTPGAVAIAPLNDIIQSEPDHARVSAVDLWADQNDVVRKAVITVTGTSASGAPQSATVTVTFSQIGQLSPITPPSTYRTIGAKG